MNFDTSPPSLWTSFTKFEEMNEVLKSEGKKPAGGERVLMGITKA